MYEQRFTIFGCDLSEITSNVVIYLEGQLLFTCVCYRYVITPG